jgi:hypothetical protein
VRRVRMRGLEGKSAGQCRRLFWLRPHEIQTATLRALAKCGSGGLAYGLNLVGTEAHGNAECVPDGTVRLACGRPPDSMNPGSGVGMTSNCDLSPVFFSRPCKTFAVLMNARDLG